MLQTDPKAVNSIVLDLYAELTQSLRDQLQRREQQIDQIKKDNDKTMRQLSIAIKRKDSEIKKLKQQLAETEVEVDEKEVAAKKMLTIALASRGSL
eukprot:COSAG03_NODE_7316_length_935_cov_3.870813_1_plen_96_part_00